MPTTPWGGHQDDYDFPASVAAVSKLYSLCIACKFSTLSCQISSIDVS